jgi:hypothetical protein
MAITRITIENFKGIGERVEVDLKPITVLFGANSAGKSTLLQAMLYLRELLERRNADADQLQASGASIDLGGFQQFVNEHDLTKGVKIGVSVEVSDDGVPPIPIMEILSLSDGNNRDFLENGISGIKSVSVEVTVRWDTKGDVPFISSYMVGINGEPFAKIVAESTMQCYITHCVPDHSCLTQFFQTEPDQDELPLECLAINDYLNEASLGEENFSELPLFRVPLNQLSPIPNLLSPLLTPDDNSSSIQPDPDSIDFQELQGFALSQFILTQLIVGSGKLVLEELKNICYIGPLRKVPTRNFELLRSPRAERWSDGLAAWDALHKSAVAPDGNGLVMATSEWLADRLQLGYSLSSRKYFEVEQDGLAHLGLEQLSRSALDQEIEEKIRLILDDVEASPTRTALSLYDAAANTTVAPCDIGVGVSQVIPVVVGSLLQSDSTVVVEQPELHLHPAVQARLGDLFINGALEDANNRFILESHSEHLMLRLLRRIRETTEKDEEYPDYLAELKPEHVSVYYVQSSAGKTEMIPLRITEDGDFKDRWPNGFFDERAEELF